MTKHSLFFALLLSSLFSFAQKQNNIWYFGDKAGIDFNSGTATAITNSNMQSFESASSISDSLGNLLFYTNGGYLNSIFGPFSGGVWNRNHVMMPNGALDASGGCNSAWQGAIIVPMPGNTNQYYFFTTDCQENTMVGGFRYGIVDMNLDGGMGDVTLKGIHLIDSVAEPICVIKHKNNIDYWVIVHKLYNTEFYAYLVNDLGIQSPIISNVGDPVFNNCGSFMATVDGTKIGIGATWKTMLFNFDASTGLLSNYIDLNKTSAGAAFSANCRFYYTASNDPPDSKVYQFDLSAANIPASAIEIHTIESPYHPFQLGPDGKIYIPSNIWNSADLDVIQNPDLLGLSCNYTVNSFNLAGKTTKGSLPNIISGLYGGCDFATSNTSVQIKTRPDISVIPNPFSNYTIFTIQNIELKNASIDILNVLGEKVDRITEINTNEIIFKRNELKSGIYFVKIISGNEVKAVSKFMIE